DVGALGSAFLDAACAAGMGVTVTLTEPTGPRTIYVSDMAARILGWPASEMIGKDPFSQAAPGDVARIRDRFAKRAQGEQGQISYELTAIRKDGTHALIDVTTSPAIVAGCPAIVTFITDAAPRKAAEEARQRTETGLHQIIENAPEPIGLIRDIHFIYTNQAFVRVLGYPSAEDVYRVPLTRLLPDEAAETLVAREASVLRGDRQPTRCYRVTRHDGTVVLLEVNSAKYVYEGRPCVLTMARDVTDKNLLEARLVQADRLAAIGTMAAGVAHEINNPLAYVMLNLEWIAKKLPEALGDPGTAESLAEMLREAHRGTERVAAIVRELRTFARADGETRHPIDLAVAVQSAVKIAGHELRHRAKVTSSFSPVGPVLANEAGLEQVVLNLLLNASHAMPESHATTNEVRITVRPEGEGRALIEVSDNGEGIDPATLPRIFDPFFSTKPRGVGMGLGLSICHGIVTALGGQITVRSVPGDGTTFRVVLPTTTATVASAIPSEPIPHSQGPRARVLVIDDEVPIVNTMRELLGANSDVTAMTSVREALLALKSQDFDVILCDLMMPEKSGIDFYEDLKQTRPDLAKRIVFMTGGAFTTRAAEFLAKVDNRRVEKPFSLTLIEAIVRDVAGARKA
ncbi:MAG: PAS domain S-box protein, partial [Polyangiaceae bacterium]